MRRIVLAVAVTVCSVVALNDAGVAQMTQAGSREAEGRRICRYSDVTGKLSLRRRVCLTKAEWDRVAEEQRLSVTRSWLQGVTGCRQAICTEDRQP
jgi:hypothetical protein